VPAATPAAKEFAEEHFPVEGWQGAPANFMTDWRPARDLMLHLADEGWRVDCEHGL
jgi:hypothetical protein